MFPLHRKAGKILKPKYKYKLLDFNLPFSSTESEEEVLNEEN